jgi:hypothetical protein
MFHNAYYLHASFIVHEFKWTTRKKRLATTSVAVSSAFALFALATIIIVAPNMAYAQLGLIPFLSTNEEVLPT